jgi:hypothetical protein
MDPLNIAPLRDLKIYHFLPEPHKPMILQEEFGSGSALEANEMKGVVSTNYPQ